MISSNFYSGQLKNILLLFLSAVFLSCTTIDFLSYSNSNHNYKFNSANSITIITYNIKAIYDKEKNEIDKLMDYVNKKNFNFVIFQELFNENTRDYIIEKADKNHFSNIIARVDYNSFPEFIFQDAGLFVMSSYPRIDLSEIEFGDDIKNSNGIIHMILDKEISRSNDFLANKSILGALFEINDSIKLFLFTTHVQALGSLEHKELQFVQIKNFIEQAVEKIFLYEIVNSTDELIIILAGDFNSDAYNEDRFIRMQSALEFTRDLHKDFHGEKQEYTFRFSSNSASRRFDYILSYDKIEDKEFKKVKVISINTIDIKNDNGKSISDHLGLEAELSIKDF